MSEKQSFGEWVEETRGYFKDNKKKLASAAAPGVDVDAYIDRLFFEISATPDLAGCTKASLWQCLSNSVILGLPIGKTHGFAYAIPRKGIACWQLGYKGQLKLINDSPAVIGAKAEAVRMADTFHYSDGTDPKIVHRPAMQDRGPAIAYWAAVWLTGGKTIINMMTRKEVEQHRDEYCPGHQKNGSAWKTSFDGMALKTVLGRPMKFAPGLSDEARRIVSEEEEETYRSSALPSGATTPASDLDRLADALGGPSTDDLIAGGLLEPNVDEDPAIGALFDKSPEPEVYA
jgi:recombination protein RecT